jgi:uridine kinase
MKFISISGGSGSGKTTASKILQSFLLPYTCQVLSQDNYYLDHKHCFSGDGSVNFDSPEALDFLLLELHLKHLTQGFSVEVPCYNFVNHSRESYTTRMHPSQFCIVDGTLVLSQPSLRPYFYASIYLSVPEDIRFSRRLKRDVEERGRAPEGVRYQFYKDVKPMHDAFVSPSQQYASCLIAYEDSLSEKLKKLSEELKKEL